MYSKIYPPPNHFLIPKVPAFLGLNLIPLLARRAGKSCWPHCKAPAFGSGASSVEGLRYMGIYGIFLIMGNAGFIS